MTSTATVHKTQRLVARQDANHRIVHDGLQWIIQHRKAGSEIWHNDAFCVTWYGVKFFLDQPSSHGQGYRRLSEWTLTPDLRALSVERPKYRYR